MWHQCVTLADVTEDLQLALRLTSPSNVLRHLWLRVLAPCDVIGAIWNDRHYRCLTAVIGMVCNLSEKSNSEFVFTTGYIQLALAYTRSELKLRVRCLGEMTTTALTAMQ